MTPGEFIAKWRASELKERSAAQEHFIDLCRLLGEPTPAEADPTGERYCFERGARQGTPAATAGPTCGSGTASRGSTRASTPTPDTGTRGQASTQRSISYGSTRWRWRTRRC